jgi:hypothetical protein
MVEMTLREDAHIHQRHFEEVGEAYASDPRLRNLILHQLHFEDRSLSLRHWHEAIYFLWELKD